MFILHAEGVDFIGPEPNALNFTSGGNIQCAHVTIVDDPLPQGQRNFTIFINGSELGGGDIDGGGMGGDGVHVGSDEYPSSVTIDIAIDLDDGKSGPLCL